AAGQARYNACINTGDARPFVQSTSFGKLREVSLALDLPEALATRFGAKSARVSITGRNLLLITKYFGYDPEVSNYGSQSIARNIDLGPYPPARQFFFTIQAGFSPCARDASRSRPASSPWGRATSMSSTPTSRPSTTC